MRIRIILILLSICLTAAAQSSKVKRYIDKYDVQYFVDDLAKGKPDWFWSAVQSHDKYASKFMKDWADGKESTQNTVEMMLQLTQVVGQYQQGIYGYSDIVSRIARRLGIEGYDFYKDHPIKVLDDNDINASMNAFGQMTINKGAIAHLTEDELLAVCAHETAHMFCVHVLTKSHKAEKKRKRNAFWAKLGTGLMVGAAAATSGYSAANGFEATGANTLLENSDIFYESFMNDANTASVRFRYRYSRDQEEQADIVAFRFMEYIGMSGSHLISAFKKMISLYGDRKTDKYDDHLSLGFRIEVLEAMQNGYKGKGK